MKKFLLTLCLIASATSFTLADQVLYCSPWGISNPTSSSLGYDWTTSLSPHGVEIYLEHFSSLLITPGNLTIYFLKGDYYEPIHLDINTTANLVLNGNVKSIYLYGGFSATYPIESLDARDLIMGPTTFHAETVTPILIDMNSISGATCVIDGIRFDTEDHHGYNNIVNYPAMYLVSGSYIISQCIVSDYHTTSTLLFLEGVDEVFNIVNSVIGKNSAAHLVNAYSELNFINSTIASNSFTNDLIGSSDMNVHYRLSNCILYDIDDWNNYVPVYYEVHNSIIEYYNSLWMIDYGYNFWNTDPLFTGHVDAPFSCLAASDASFNGEPSDLTGLDVSTNSAFSDILFYDAANHERFDDMMYLVHLDIGAYQHYSNNTYYFQPQSLPSPQREKELEYEGIDVNTIGYNILGQRVDDTYHGIVIRNGQKVLQ